MGCLEKFWWRMGPKRASDIGGYIGSKVWGMIGARAWTQYGVAWANSWWPKARHVSWAYEFFGGILHVHFRSKMTILCCAKWRHVRKIQRVSDGRERGSREKVGSGTETDPLGESSEEYDPFFGENSSSEDYDPFEGPCL
jgi:hypothetical protein